MSPLYNYVDSHISRLSAENALLRERLDALSVTREKLDNEVKNISTALEGYEGLCENVRNLNSAIAGYEGLCENVRNINSAIAGYEGLCENVRNINSVLESYEGLCENVRNINSSLDGYENVILNLRNLNNETDKVRSDIDRLNFTLSKINRAAGTAGAAPQKTAVQEVKAAPDENYLSIDYFKFENYFRGSREKIKENQKFYLKYFNGCKQVLDLGCGRGEFLELLKENGINAVGADTYEDFAEYCRTLGLNAVCGDGIAFLKSMDNVDGIFVGQVVEHLKVNQIIDLIESAYSKLPENGVLIMETPNPTSLSTYVNAFYLDPSHVKPVHPELLRYLLRGAGYRQIEVVFTESSRPDIRIAPLKDEKDFNRSMETVQEILFGSQDYAIIARK